MTETFWVVLAPNYEPDLEDLALVGETAEEAWDRYIDDAERHVITPCVVRRSHLERDCGYRARQIRVEVLDD